MDAFLIRILKETDLNHAIRVGHGSSILTRWGFPIRPAESQFDLYLTRWGRDTNQIGIRRAGWETPIGLGWNCHVPLGCVHETIVSISPREGQQQMVEKALVL